MHFFAERMSGEGFRQVTVFNPLSWKRTEWVTVYVSFHSKGEAKNVSVKCGDAVFPAHIILANYYSDGSIMDATIAFNASLDPLSLTTFSIIPSVEPLANDKNRFTVDEKELRIKTPFYEFKLNPAGGIEFLKNAQNEYLLQNGNDRSAFFEGTIDGVIARSAGRWSIQRAQGSSPRIKMSETGFIADVPYTFEMTLYEDKPVIECKAGFDFNGQKIGLPTEDRRDSHSPFVHDEKLRFKMFPRVEKSATGVRDLPFAIAETSDKAIEGNYWTALTDGKVGWAVFNKGNMAIIREKDQGLSIPLVYSTYYIWGTRMLYGKQEYEFAFYPFKGNWQSADLHRKALEYAFSAPTWETQRTANELGHKVNPVQMQFDNNDVILTALYPQKESIIARFFKYNDKSGQSTVKINADAFGMTEVDLNGKTLTGTKTLLGYNNWYELRLTPWQFKTIRMDKK